MEMPVRFCLCCDKDALNQNPIITSEIGSIVRRMSAGVALEKTTSDTLLKDSKKRDRYCKFCLTEGKNHKFSIKDQRFVSDVSKMRSHDAVKDTVDLIYALIHLMNSIDALTRSNCGAAVDDVATRVGGEPFSFMMRSTGVQFEEFESSNLKPLSVAGKAIISEYFRDGLEGDSSKIYFAKCDGFAAEFMASWSMDDVPAWSAESARVMTNVLLNRLIQAFDNAYVSTNQIVEDNSDVYEDRKRMFQDLVHQGLISERALKDIFVIMSTDEVYKDIFHETVGDIKLEDLKPKKSTDFDDILREFEEGDDFHANKKDPWSIILSGNEQYDDKTILYSDGMPSDSDNDILSLDVFVGEDPFDVAKPGDSHMNGGKRASKTVFAALLLFLGDCGTFVMDFITCRKMCRNAARSRTSVTDIKLFESDVEMETNATDDILL
jgi:hypothetical protein